MTDAIRREPGVSWFSVALSAWHDPVARHPEGCEFGYLRRRDADNCTCIPYSRTDEDALALLDQKRTDEALPLLAQAADANPGIAPYLRLRIVDAARA